MKYFVQDDEGTLTEVCFRDLLGEKLTKDLRFAENITVEIDRHTDGSGSWVQVEQKIKTKEEKKVITTLISFDVNGKSITDFNIYHTPIEELINHDETKCLTKNDNNS